MAENSWWELLLDALAARRGIVCTVGAGGKKTTLHRLVEAHAAAGTARVGLTATVMLAAPPPSLGGERLIGAPETLRAQVPEAAARAPLVVYAQPSPKPGRFAGVAPELVAELHASGGFTVTLAKADGARMRAIKAPAPGEPVLPPGTATVLPVVSAKAIGRPLDETIAHRPDRLARVTGAAPGEPLTPEHIARLLASPEGALQGIGDATAVPIINMVDERNRAGAREAARLALERTGRFDRVVLATMTAPDAILEVLRR